jgi:hypothetical protein
VSEWVKNSERLQCLQRLQDDLDRLEAGGQFFQLS